MTNSDFSPSSKNDHDVRWVQRFNNFERAFSQLKEAVALHRKRPFSKLEDQGLIQAFEFTHELAWNTMKDFLEDQGTQYLFGSKDTTREAFRVGLIENGDIWMEMIKSRNLTSHTYDEKVATDIVSAILERYFTEFEAMESKFEGLRSNLTSEGKKSES